jgi:protein gp37
VADTKIEWTWTPRPGGKMAPGYTFNGWRGCQKVSPGCANCYAETMSGRNPGTLGEWGSAEEGGVRVVGAEAYWRLPAVWDAESARSNERRKVFALSLGDWLEAWDGPVKNSRGESGRVHPDEPDRWEWGEARFLSPFGVVPLTLAHVRMRLLAAVYLRSNLDWLLLTKRPQNWRPLVAEVVNLTPRGAGWDEFRAWLGRWLGGDAPANVWFGISAENQPTLKHRAPPAEAVPTVCRWVSYEPSLGPLDVADLDPARWHWIIAGGESGSGARPFDVAWARACRDQCRAKGIAFYLKQLGAEPTEGGVRVALDMIDRLKGARPEEWPEDLRVREYPAVDRTGCA